MSTPAAIDRSTMNGKTVIPLAAKSVINFKSGFAEKLLCDGPTFSTGTACAYSCEFCYVKSMFSRSPNITDLLSKAGKEFEDVVIRRDNPIEIARSQIFDGKGRPKFKDDNRVIYSSPLVDVAANMDLVRESAEMARLLLENTGWTIRFLSKSNLLPKLAEMLSDYRDRVIYGVSTGTLNDDLAKAFETGTPLVSKRIESLHKLQDDGYRTFGMICPSLPLPSGEYTRFSREISAAIRVDKCEHVWAEVMNVRGESLTRTMSALSAAGFNDLAQMVRAVREDSDLWEDYARVTFEAHTMFIPAEKLRYLQYVTKKNADWWLARVPKGAVLLGAEAAKHIAENAEEIASVK